MDMLMFDSPTNANSNVDPSLQAGIGTHLVNQPPQTPSHEGPIHQQLRPQRPPPTPRKTVPQSRSARKARDAYGDRVETYNPRRDARRKAERKATVNAWRHEEAVKNAQENGLPIPLPPPPPPPGRRRRLRPGSMFLSVSTLLIVQ